MTIAHRKIHKKPAEKTILLAILAAGFAAGGTLAWKWVEQAQSRRIQQAQNQLVEVCRTRINSNTSAIEASRKVDEATRLLQNIPQIPGLGYQTAQDQLTSFSSCVQNVKSKEDFFAAEQLSQTAMATGSSTILATSEWRTLQSDLEKAIDLLNRIPEDTDIYTEAQQDLQIYRTQLQQINQRLTHEAEADRAFAKAEQLGQSANAILTDSPNDAALAEAGTQLETAIAWLKTIPEGHKVSTKAQENLAAYQQQLTNIHYQQATSQLKILTNDFYDFVAFLDVTLTYHTYSKQLNQFNDRFNALVEISPAILDHAAAESLQKALSQCDDAMSIWRYCHEGNCSTSWEANILDWRDDILWIPASFMIGERSLAQAYPVHVVHNIWTQPYVQQNSALSTIWESAKQDVAAAQAEIR